MKSVFRKIFVFSFLNLILIGLTSPAVYAESRQAVRDKMIDKELSCISQAKNQGRFTWSDVCYLDNQSEEKTRKSVNVIMDENGLVTVGKEVQPDVEEQGSSEADVPKEEPKSGKKKKGKPKPEVAQDLEEETFAYEGLGLDSDASVGERSYYGRDGKKLNFEFGSENLYYKFKSDDNIIKRTGSLFGVFGTLTYRFGPQEDLAKDNSITMLKLDGHLAQDVDVFMFDGRGLAGYDLLFRTKARLTPYIGIGFRYWRDKDGGMTKVIDDIYSRWFYTDGATYVKEEFKYIYLPIGFEFHQPLAHKWAVQLTCEYDIFLQGRVTRHYSELGPLIISATDGSGHIPNDMEFTQDKGYGWRIAVKFLRAAEKVDLYFEPFIRFWRTEDSDIEQFKTDNETSWYYAATGEPVIDWISGNKITEYGFKAGVLF